MLQTRFSSNEYSISGVRVTDARDGFTCSVFIEGEGDPLATGTNSLNITSKPTEVYISYRKYAPSDISGCNYVTGSILLV